MEKNMYQPPKSEINCPVVEEIPRYILNKIRRGWIAAVVFCILIIAIMAYLIVSQHLPLGKRFIPVAVFLILTFSLAFGIYRKSRVAAAAMFSLFLVFLFGMYFTNKESGGVILLLLFLYFYLDAMLATFKYHRIKQGSDAGSSQSID